MTVPPLGLLRSWNGKGPGSGPKKDRERTTFKIRASGAQERSDFGYVIMTSKSRSLHPGEMVGTKLPVASSFVRSTAGVGLVCGASEEELEPFPPAVST